MSSGKLYSWKIEVVSKLQLLVLIREIKSSHKKNEKSTSLSFYEDYHTIKTSTNKEHLYLVTGIRPPTKQKT